MATPSSAPVGAVCDDKAVCKLPPRAAARDDGVEALVPLPRTLRPLDVLEDEAGNKLATPGVFENKVSIYVHRTSNMPTTYRPLHVCSFSQRENHPRPFARHTCGVRRTPYHTRVRADSRARSSIWLVLSAVEQTRTFTVTSRCLYSMSRLRG